MSLFGLFLFLHILGVIVWVGTAVAMELLTWKIERAREVGPLRELLSLNSWLGTRVFAPAGLLTLAMGVLMVATSHQWQFGQLWVILGLIGLFVAVGVGAGLIGRTAQAISQLLLHYNFDSQTVKEQLWRLNLYSLLHTALMAVIILDMVIKPTIHNLVFFGLAILIFAIALLSGWRGRPITASA